MRAANKRIGFDDRLMVSIMIPLAALLIPIIFFGRRFGREPYFTWQVYITTVISTTLVWFGNRYIMIRARTRYPLFEDTRKRLIIQSLSMLIFTLITSNTIHYFERDICALMMGSKDIRFIDILISSNASAIFCTVLGVAIYENIYFVKQLRRSVEEKEFYKRDILHAQLNALKTQVNPHFLFNNLNTLSSLIPENPTHAISFVQELSKVYRHILQVKDDQSITLKDELEVMNAYAFLLQTRFGNNLQVSIDVPEEKLGKRLVPLSLQLLMENAIKHNIVSAQRPLKIEVFTENGRLVVRNNLQVKNQLHDSTGIGLDNIRNRYKLLGNEPVIVSESEKEFVVSIPLLN
ncbi:sensor histidine kinase [Ferruginibacter sp. HRS2-29]|uniref:sensor histidine kinase n=1 Tax=Ferruginibacter sp. HRS2-29 TaxID=2487334 RepID=UPI0020CFA19B|nr:histidine kinase [Ferruginibacter sp. HRS2-29]MCP9751109.1 histidine kinase [Ferruginibacter sp. HRS2-29]